MSAKEKTTGFLAEFRKFIARGNVMDLAVGVIIGGAFKGITGKRHPQPGARHLRRGQ